MKKITYWIPSILVMTLIFILSHQSQSTLQVTQQPLSEFIIKKTAHFIVYGILATTYYYALKKTSTSKAILISWTLATIYAITDEYHQTLIPTRTGTIRDIIIDSIGAITFLKLLTTYKLDFLNK